MTTPLAAVPAGRPRNRWRRMLRRALLLGCAAVLVCVTAAGLQLAVTPSVGSAELLAEAQALAHGAAVPGPPVPARFAAALVATEDHRFYSEPFGVDPFAAARVAFSYLTGQGDPGGATLYQQLAKMLYTPGRSGPAVVGEQAALALKLDMTYSKRQILQMYAEVVYFGHGFYGLAAASCGYFGVRPAGLSWPQAAVLAGVVQDPSADDPLRYPAAARAREEHVLGRLVATGMLSPTQARVSLALPLSRLLSGAGGCPGLRLARTRSLRSGAAGELDEAVQVTGGL